MITVEQIVNTQKTNIDTFFGLSGKAFEGVEKLIELNLSAAKSAMAEAAQNTKLVLSAKDPQELVALQSSLMQPAALLLQRHSRFPVFSEVAAELPISGSRHLGPRSLVVIPSLSGTTTESVSRASERLRCPEASER